MIGDSRELQGYLKKVKRVFQGTFKAVQRRFKEASRVLKDVSSFFKESSKGVSKTFNEVLFVLQFFFARISSQLPEQKEGLFFT